MAVATAGSVTGDRSSVTQLVGLGALWGVAGAIVMAIYAMIAGATYLGSGFFTPLYHIASTFLDPQSMMISMEHAMEGEAFYFTFGAAGVGMLVHLVVGAVYGIVFALLARAINLVGPVSVALGALYGVAVMLFSSFVGLPIAAELFGGGDPIADMPTMVGWSTFTIEHVIFGLALGIGWVAQRSPRGQQEGIPG
ncbi:MAG: hypothetical protein M3280_01555 [Actinomycetota bacterium]|nr:hypothetical protein [Actinomycetota bacterium]